MRSRDLEITKNLLDKLTLSDMEEAEPILLVASSQGDEEICCLLVTAVAASVADLRWHPSLICRAGWLGLDRLVRLLARNGASVEARVDNLGPLHYAARNNHAEVVHFLIEMQPNLVKMQNNDSITALQMAVENGHAEIADILIRAGAEVNFGHIGTSITLACFYGKHAVARVLVEKGVEIEYEVGENEWPALPGAAFFGFTKCVAAILDSGRADIDHGSPGGTALPPAVNNGYLETTRLLLQCGADPESENNDDPVIVIAARAANLDAAQLLLESGRTSQKNRTHALYAAASAGTSVEMVQLLLQNGADPNGQTPTSPVLHAAVYGRNVDILRELISKGVKLDIVDSQGQTALHVACGNASMAQALLEAGADANFAMTSDGTTPLHCAVEFEELDLLKAILETQPELEVKLYSSHSNPGFTPLALAVWQDNAEITRLLLEAGADPNARIGPGNQAVSLQFSTEPEVVSALLDFEADLTLEDADGDTPLNNLIGWKSVKVPVVKMLLHQGSDVNKANNRGQTPLFTAICQPGTAFTRLLLDRGADPNHVSKYDGTLLHAACRRGTFEAFELILNKIGFVEQQHPVVGSIISAVCMRLERDDDVAIMILQHLRDSYSRKMLALNERCGRYGCALNTACFWREKGAVDWLLSEQVSVHTGDNAGRYPIHFAAYRNISIFDRIRDNGANLKVRDKMGRTILHIATQSGSYDLVKHVLDINPYLLNVQDNDGWTPLHYAARGIYYFNVSRTDCPDPDEEIVNLLLYNNVHAGEDIKVYGHEELWSVLKLARFHGASARIRRILKLFLIEQRGDTWNPLAHVTRKALDNRTSFCDHCFIVSTPWSVNLVGTAFANLFLFPAPCRVSKRCVLLAKHAANLISVTSASVTGIHFIQIMNGKRSALCLLKKMRTMTKKMITARMENKIGQ